jgi:glycosyltransferase involved in cell wall biosynthesis
MEMIKVVFAGHDLKFAQLIMDYLRKTGKYDIRVDEWKGHNIHNEDHSMECLQWADVIVCEWGLGNAVWYSENKLPHQKLIIRMHLQEVDTDYPKNFNLDNVDQIIAISPYVYEEFYRKFKLPREKMTMIYNVVETKKLDQPKQDDSSYHLGMVGICPKRKRLDLAVDILEKLWQQDNRYKLFIKGKMPQDYPWLWRRDEERQYYEELFQRIEEAPWKDAVIFDGFGSDMDQWFRKIGYVLSTSDFESFHLSPSEGMASGAYPIILKWDGSDTIYEERYLLKDVNECVSRIIELNSMELKLSMEKREKAKRYVQQHFDVQEIGKQWDNLLEEMTTNAGIF